MTYGPSWLGIGAQRCGTTWFTSLLTQHPQVDVAGGIKEHHLLYRYGLTQEWTDAVRDEYRTQFTSGDLRLGEFTPYYMRASWIVELVADALPEDAPIIVLVRDPVDRFASGMRHAMTRAARLQRKAEGKPLADRAKKPPKNFDSRRWLRNIGSDVSWAGMYAAQLSAWTSVLPRDRFEVIQYEKLVQDPQHYTDLLWKRLGLDPIPLQKVRRRFLASRKKAWVSDDYPAVVRALQRIYRPDAEELAQQFDIDLTLWKRTMSEGASSD